MRLRLWILLAVAVLALGWLIRDEMRSSFYQSQWFSRHASTLTYSLEEGVSERLRYPEFGPFNQRLGYSLLPGFIERLQDQGFAVTHQVRFSDELLAYADKGLYPPYREKTRSGLQVRDCKADSIYQFRYPLRQYASFDHIPPLLVSSLLFIENRHLLNPDAPLANPAVDWPRFLKASLSLVSNRWDENGGSSPGASTLATQIEKYRHSPEGRTHGPKDKLLQMGSASFRAYLDGPNTEAARQRLVLDYLNTVPLAAAPGHGEVIGLGDALWVWYVEDFHRFNQNLRGDHGLQAQALALRQALSMLIAQRRPSYYLLQGREDMHELVDSHIRLLAREGVVDPQLRQAALETHVRFRDWSRQPVRPRVAADKAVTVTRSRIAGLLGQTLYGIDRMDLQVDSSLHLELQRAASEYLESLADPEVAGRIGLFGERLLSPEKVGEVRYSFTLMQRTPEGNQVRVQTDNTGLPFDLNEGSKLELGSTAKLRVLVTYLEIIAELYDQLSEGATEAIQEALSEPDDRISVWAATWLRANPEATLEQMLEAALERRYSASPHEQFFTGGGVQRFSNFRNEDNGRNPTVREAIRESINLPFVRLLRDIVRYTIHQTPGSSIQLLRDDRDPRRAQYLEQFADREGRTFLLRFWRKYSGKNEAERMETFLDGLRPTVTRLAAVYRYLYPESTPEELAEFLARRTGEQLSESRINTLHRDYGPGRYNLPDQGYIARVHPLELWLLGYLRENPEAQFLDAVEASRAERQEVYGWLFRTRHRGARDVRIRTMLEVEAFLDIHRRWQRLGYPFEHMVPSLGSALGSAGDRPAALAELMGIINNEGLRYRTGRINTLHFAGDTPYETRFERVVEPGQQVIPRTVARVLRNVLADVVEGGTARRLQGAFVQDGQVVLTGGKTGTGDNRIHSMAADGRSIGSQVMNRTATFVFFLGDEHFGTLTAFVPGQAAEGFRFTSALPVQVLRGMAPFLMPYLTGAEVQCLPRADYSALAP